MSETIVKNTTPFIDVYMNERDVQIPENWKVVDAKDMLSFTSGFTPYKKRKELYDGDDVWINISDMKESVVNDSSKKIHGELCNKEKTKKGSLLFSFKLSVGRVAFAGIDLYTNEAIWSFDDKCKIPLKYLYYYLPIYLTKRCQKNIYGANTLNQKILFETQFALPPSLKEQERIASYLSNLEYRLNRASRAVVLMETKLRYYSRELLTGRLRLTDSGDIVKNDEWKDVVVNERDVQIPENWSVEKINKLVKIKSGKDKKNVNGAFCLYGANGIIGKTDNAQQYKHQIIVGRVGSVGKIHMINGMFGISDNALIIDNINVDNRFFYYYLHNMSFKNIKKGGVIPLITAGDIKKQDAITPPINEQNRIASYLSDIEKALDIKRREKIRCEEKLAWASKALLSGKYVLR